MGEPACSLLDAEVALDRLDAELASELVPHMRAFARSYVTGGALPAAPAAMRRASSLEVARRALVHPELADRALGLLRLIVPTLLDDDPRVARARQAAATWPAMLALAAARDEAARARFGVGAVPLLHALHGSEAVAAAVDLPPPIEGWTMKGAPIQVGDLVDAWGWLARRHGGRMIHLEVGDVRPRTFVVDPRREVIVVHPEVIDTPAARFAVMHEYGHALAAFLVRADQGVLPRAVDEAVASYIARLIEHRDQVAPGWYSPHAAAARARRLAVAMHLDAIERALPAIGELPSERPPWALWHDPGAQAAYVTAEAIADRWWATLGPHPVPGALADAIAGERARIDRATVL